MTWFTTHLALEGMIAFIFICYSLRSKFLKNNSTRALFLLANTFAIIPDFDVYIGILFNNREHRGPTHSIFFPLTFLAIGFLILLYNKMKSQDPNHPLADIESLFKSDDKVKSQLLYLLPYFFFLAAFFWGLHLVLDQDAVEGGMMMFWPLDNRLYEIKLIFTLNANPFLILPWQPLGASFQVTQSTIIGLYNYLFNWTPQDFINATGSTIFQYEFVGLILHSLILITWFYFVLRPCWPLQGKNIGSKFNFFGFFSKVKHYWQHIAKELLIPAIMLILIGFSFGPLVTNQVPDNQTMKGNLSFTNSSFNAVMYAPIDAVSQPLDPNAHFTIAVDFIVSNFQTGDQLYYVVANESVFSSLQQQISTLLSTVSTTNPPVNDTVFKRQYTSIITKSLTNKTTIVLKSISTFQIRTEPTINNLLSNANYGVGFVLKDWSSKPQWFQTNTTINIASNIDVTYSRNVNYWIGIVIESIGILMAVIALILPFKIKIKTFKKFIC